MEDLKKLRLSLDELIDFISVLDKKIELMNQHHFVIEKEIRNQRKLIYISFTIRSILLIIFIYLLFI